MKTKSSLTICLLCRTFQSERGGTETYTYSMAKSLAKKGHDVHIIAARGGEKYYLNGLEGGITVHKIDFNPYPFRGAWRLDNIFPFENVRYTWAVASRIKQISERHSFDIIETPEWGSEAFWYVRKRTMPVHVTLHGHPKLMGNSKDPNFMKNSRNRIIWNMKRDMILKADGVSTTSKAFADFAKKFWKLQDLKIHVTGLGVDLNMFKPKTDHQRERAVLFVGRLQETKGIGVLAEAIPKIIEKFPNVKFYFAGRDFLRVNGQETWTEYIRGHIPEDNLVFLGILDPNQLIEYYQKCSVAVFPSLYEPGGIVALEAMACGCATVATEVGGFSESIRNDENGILVRPGNADDLSVTVLRLFEDESLRKKISENGIISSHKDFDFDSVADKTLDSYQTAIDCFRPLPYKADC